MLLNVLKLFGNRVGLSKVCLWTSWTGSGGIGGVGCSRTYTLLKSFWQPSCPVVGRNHNVYWKGDGRIMHGTAILRSYYGRVRTWCSWASLDINTFVHQPWLFLQLFLFHSQTNPTGPLNVLSASLISANTFKTKWQDMGELAHTCLCSSESLQYILSTFYSLQVWPCLSHAVLTMSTASAVVRSLDSRVLVVHKIFSWLHDFQHFEDFQQYWSEP